MRDETTAILSIAADRFLAGRHANARNVFAAISRGQDPRAPGHVVCVREGRLFDVELPRPDLGRGPSFIACLLRAEHVVGLEEQLDVGQPDSERPSLVPTPEDLGVRLLACEAWIEQRSEVRISERYVSFPREVRWTAETPDRLVLDRYLFDYEAAFSPNGLTDEQARVILEHKGCRITDLDLEQTLDRWIADYEPELSRDFGPASEPPFGPNPEPR